MVTVNSAQGSESQLLFKKQSAIGNPATGNYTRTRFKTHTLKPDISSIESEEIQGDRELIDHRNGNRSASGQITCELVYEAQDWFLESAFFNTFDTQGHLTIGGRATRQYLSIEDGATDITEYVTYSDMMVSSAEFTIQPNALIETVFDMVGLIASGASGSSGGGTPVAAPSGKPFDSFTGSLFDNIAETGSEIAVITSMKLKIENQLAPLFVVGQQTGVDIESDIARVSGELQMLYTDSFWINRRIDETEFALVLTLVDLDGNEYKFRMPRVKLSDANAPVSDKKARRMNTSFIALKHPDYGYSIRIEKTDA